MDIERFASAPAGLATGLGSGLTAALLVSACTLGPAYKTPEVDTPAAWSAAASAAVHGIAGQAVVAPFDGARWWRVFNDPLLDQLIDEAVRQNLDVQTAVLRIASARSQRQVRAGAAYPSAVANGVAGRTRMSENGIAGALGGGAAASPSAGASAAAPSAVSTNLFQIGFDATWEIDLWGKVRNQVAAADADIAAAVAGRDDALASLSAEIARTYLDLRGAGRQLAISRADLATRQRLAELVNSRQRAGFSTQADVLAQSAQVEAAQAQIPPLEQSAAQARNRLALLLALPPGALDERLASLAPGATTTAEPTALPPVLLPGLPPELPIGLPGDLLRRRPDVRSSEAQVRSATAQVGAARASLFPSITLGLAAGLQSTLAGDLTDWGSRFVLGGASIMVPVFQGGQLRAQVELAGLDAQRSALAYRQTVLVAVHDADNALIAYGQEQRRTVALAGQLRDAARGRELAIARWRQGLGAFIDVLDATRTAHQAELALAQSSTTAATDLVALFKALGGGWDS